MSKQSREKSRARRQKNKGGAMSGQRSGLTAVMEPDAGVEAMVRDLCGMNTRQIAVRASSIDSEARCVESVLSTENRVRMYSYMDWEWVDEILLTSGCRHSGKVPLLDSHRRSSIGDMFGFVDRIRAEGEQMIGLNNFARDIADVDDAWARVEQKILTDTSVGYRYEASDRVMIPAGSSAFVDDREFTADEVPLVIVRGWDLIENSLVPIGADEHAKIRGYGVGTSKREKEKIMYNEEQLAYMRSLGWNGEGDASAYYDGMLESARTYCNGLKTRSVDPAPTPPATPPLAVAEPTRAAEVPLSEAQIRADESAKIKERHAHVNDICCAATPKEDRQRAMDDELSIEELSRRELKRLHDGGAKPLETSYSSGGRIEMGEHNSDMGMRAMADAVAMPYGHVVSDSNRAQAAEPFRGMRLTDLARECIVADGGTVPHNRAEFIKRALSSVSLGNLLADSMNKIVVGTQQMAETTIDKWCAKAFVSDFKTNTKISLSSFSRLEDIGNGAPIPYGGLKDNGETFKLKTRGKKFRLSREHLINDDLNALLVIAKIMGFAAFRTREDVVYDLVKSNPTITEDSKPLFSTHADRAKTGKNLITGGTSAFGAGGMKLLTQLVFGMKGMKSEKGDVLTALGLRPSKLLTGSDLYFDALQLLNSPAIHPKDADEGRGTTNVLRGLVEPIMVPQFTTAGEYYLTVDPHAAESVTMSFLDGNELPIVEDVSLPGEQGRTYQVVDDFGADVTGHRGMYKAAGQ